MILACRPLIMHQYQFCIPRIGKDDFCTELTGSPLEVEANDYPDASPVQLSILQLLRSMTRLIAITMGPLFDSLQASNTVQRGSSPGLPAD